METLANVPRQILVAESDVAVRELLVHILQTAGYRLVVAADGEEALRAIVELHPTLVVMGTRLPILDARSLMAILRERGITVPIVLVTGMPDPASLAHDLGAADYVAKPFDVHDLLAVVRRFVPAP